MKNKNWILTKSISHRGEEIDNIENSIGSFQAAIDKNMIIELDVVLTKDNHLIVFHDANAKRLLGINKQIRNMNFEQIRQLYLPNGQKIITLEEALGFINHRTEVIIDIKPQITVSTKRVAEAVTKCIKKYEAQDNYDIAVQSFDPFILRRVRKQNPKILIGQLAYFIEDLILYPLVKPDFIATNFNSMNIFIKLRKFLKLPVLGWEITEDNFFNAKTKFDNLIMDLENHTNDNFVNLKETINEIKKEIQEQGLSLSDVYKIQKKLHESPLLGNLSKAVEKKIKIMKPYNPTMENITNLFDFISTTLDKYLDLLVSHEKITSKRKSLNANNIRLN